MKENLNGKEGFMALDAMFAIMAFLIMLPLLATLVSRGADEVEKRAVAEHLATVLDATAEYVSDNRKTLLPSTGATSPVGISIADLRNGNHLLPGFSDLNPWGQSYGIYILQPSPDKLEGIVLTYGGRSHSTAQPEFGTIVVPSAAALVGGAGGFVPTGVMPGQSPSTLEGAYGGWRVPLSGTSIPIPPPGHLGGLSSLRGDSAVDQDFLYRVAVPGNPELNAMQTELDMTDHAIRGVREIQFEEHTLADIDASGFCNDPSKNGRIFYDPDEGLYLCQEGNPEVFVTTANSLLMKEATVVVDGELIDKPTCPPGTNTTPRIHTTPAIVAEGDPAAAMSSIQTWATDLGTEWQAHLRVLTPNGWVNPGPNYGRIQVLTACE